MAESCFFVAVPVGGVEATWIDQRKLRTITDNYGQLLRVFICPVYSISKRDEICLAVLMKHRPS